jgi:cytochrome c oxidase subunit 2
MSNESLLLKGDLWFPSLLDQGASGVDLLFWGVFIVSVVFFIAIVAVMFYFLWKFRRTPTNQRAVGHVLHNTTLEIVWTVIPLILTMILFVWGFVDYLKLTVPPADAKEIRVIAKKWLWQFEYSSEGITTVNELYVPVGKAIDLRMSSEDVLHSFFIPNARRKKDVLPFRYTSLWFRADRVGDFQIFCTEYCGDAHSRMIANLHVLSESDFKDWIAKQNTVDETPLGELGLKVYKGKGACFTCHSLDGSPMTGPTFKGLYGKNREFTVGAPAVADDNYIKESIYDPMKKIVKGFNPGMPPYKGILSEREVAGVIEFLKTQK